MIICLHKWANMHIGDFKDMIALVASTSHFNLEYLDLCKFKLFDEPLELGLDI